MINGIPVLFIESKAAAKIDGIGEAMDQVRRYHHQCPELMAVLQVYTLTHIIHFYYSLTWTTSDKLLFNWKEEVKGDFEGLVKTFIDAERVIKLLINFILFTRQDDELKKVIMRLHQIRAIEKVVKRAESDTGRGLV